MNSETNSEDPRMPLTSADVLGGRMEQLRELFPEAFVEGAIDFDRLRNALGDFVGEGRERYGLSFWAGKGMLFICLASPITQECLRGMAELEPQRVISLDAAFGGNDQIKTNIVLEMKSHGIEFRTV